MANGTILLNHTSGGPILNYTGTGDSSNRAWRLRWPLRNRLSPAQFGQRHPDPDRRHPMTQARAFGTNSFEANGGDMALLGTISNPAGAKAVTYNGSAGRTITFGGANT